PTDRYQSVQEMVEAVFGAEHVRMSVSHFSPDDLSMVAGRVAQKVMLGPDGPGGGGSSSVVGGAEDVGNRIQDRLAQVQQRLQDSGERMRENFQRNADRMRDRFRGMGVGNNQPVPPIPQSGQPSGINDSLPLMSR